MNLEKKCNQYLTYVYISQISIGEERHIRDVQVYGIETTKTYFEYVETRIGNTDSLLEEGTGLKLTKNRRCGVDSGPGPK